MHNWCSTNFDAFWVNVPEKWSSPFIHQYSISESFLKCITHLTTLLKEQLERTLTFFWLRVYWHKLKTALEWNILIFWRLFKSVDLLILNIPRFLHCDHSFHFFLWSAASSPGKHETLWNLQNKVLVIFKEFTRNHSQIFLICGLMNTCLVRAIFPSLRWTGLSLMSYTL